MTVLRDFENFRSVILMEESKRCVPLSVKNHLDEHKVKTLQSAATIVDEFESTHKHSQMKFHVNINPNQGRFWESKSQESGQKKNLEKANDTSVHTERNKSNKSRFVTTCWSCHKKGISKLNVNNLLEKREKCSSTCWPCLCSVTR